MKSYIKHMSKQTHRIKIPKSDLDISGKIAWTIFYVLIALWIFRWPVLFIISLFY